MIIKLVPYPDEHIYSFVRRLADANAIPFRMFLEYYFGKDRKRQIDYDMKEGFPIFCKQAFPNDNQADRFFELTTAPFDIIFLTEQNQSRFISNIFEPQTPLNNTLSIGVNNLRLCPQCLQEDIAEYGEAYFHRAHQLEGVRCCYKHNVPLMEYRKPRSRTAGYDLQDYTELLTGPQEQALQYARYAKDLLDAKLGVNLKEIQQYMLRRGFGLGMSSVTQSNLFTLGQNESWPKEYFYGEYVSPTKFLPILMMLSPSVEQLKSQLNESQLIDEYLCKCGNVCYQGSWAHKNRLRACHCIPYNDSKIHYDSQNEQYLLRPNHQLIIPTDIMTDKMNWKEDGSEFIIQLKNSTDDELDRIRQFLTGTGCNILLHAESFYLPLELSTFKSPTKYKPGWHIENGIMYVTDKKLEQLVFSDTIYQLHNMKKDI